MTRRAALGCAVLIFSSLGLGMKLYAWRWGCGPELFSQAPWWRYVFNIATLVWGVRLVSEDR